MSHEPGQILSLLRRHSNTLPSYSIYSEVRLSNFKNWFGIVDQQRYGNV